MQRVLRPALPHTMGLWYGIKYREYWNYHHDQAFLGATDLKEEMWDQMIDDLYDLIGGRQTVWAGTEAFMEESSLRTRFVPFFRTTIWGQANGEHSLNLSSPFPTVASKAGLPATTRTRLQACASPDMIQAAFRETLNMRAERDGALRSQ